MKAIDIRVRLPQQFRPSQLTSEFYGRYEEVLSVLESSEKTLDDLKKEMKASGVDFAVIHAEYEYGDVADELNDTLANLVANNSETFTGFGTVSLTNVKPMRIVEQAKNIHRLGLKGINLQPIFFGIHPLDSKLYPLYATASELGLIVSFHTGIHYSTEQPMLNNNPMFIDQIACDFPNLKIIACHGGWPWTNEMVAVARRHRNVYIEFGGIAPKYIGKEGSGWDMLFRMMDNLLSDQILFGTDWPVIPLSRAVNEWQETGLKEKTLYKLFRMNSMKLLNLEGKIK